MGVVTMIAGLILSLSILVVLHEMGHFLPAKFFNTKVEKFYLFFDPWFSLFKKKIGETEYGIGWLPLGGYVKIAGMIDESFDTEQMEAEPQPWEFRSKPAWQRLIIMLGGVTVNFLLGFLIFGLLLYTYGEEYLPAENAIYGIQVDSLGNDMGLRDGDKILSIGGTKFEKFSPSTLTREIVLNGVSELSVMRDGRETSIDIDPKFVGMLSSHDYKEFSLFTARYPFVISDIRKNSPAEEAGLEKGDQITSVNGEKLEFVHQIIPKIKQHIEEEIQIGLKRDRQDLTMAITTGKDGTIGANTTAGASLTFARQDYTLLQALPAGVAKGYNFVADQIKAFGKMFQGKIKAKDSLGGFGTITKLFPEVWDWERFWLVTAMLSMILGFMNLLPIPALDGGHVMFLLFEAFTGRKLSDKFMEYATLVGFILVIGLVLYANGLDIMRGCS